MKPNIFTSTKNWKYTNNDQIAQQKFMIIEKQVRQSLPDNFYQRPIVYYQQIKSTRLYNLMKTIPKGVLHHIHYLCNDDQQFYKQYFLNDPRIYLTKQLNTFKIGTAQQAQKNGWISMKEGKLKYGQEQWLSKIVNLTCFSHQEMQEMNYKSRQIWQVFQWKILCPLEIYYAKDIFQNYIRHMFKKCIKNGYDRLEARLIFQKLNEFDNDGNLIKKYSIQTFVQIVDSVIEQINKQFPNFSFGGIIVGFKGMTDQQIENQLKSMCSLNWDKVVGIDFVQEQDKFDSLQRFDKITNKVLADCPHLNHLKKVYHAGETTNHLTDNIDIAIKAGTVRIGHGINILQRIQLLPHCKHICFQKNPISNLLLGYKSDLRDSSAPVLLGLGYPVSISSDDPGKFGVQDSTVDYFISAVSFNWTLRHLKLIAYHSINHALCQQTVKRRLINSFQRSWDKWIANFLEEEHISQSKNVYKYQDIFSFNKSWSFSEIEQEKNKLYVEYVDKVVANTSIDIYQNNFIAYKQQIKASSLFDMLKKMPKGTLQSCHFTTIHDLQFIKTCVIPTHNIYHNDYTKQLVICTPKQNELHQWTSLQKLKLTYESQEELAQYIYSLTSFNKQELGITIGHEAQFWKIYNKKYSNLINLLSSQDIFRKYTQYVFRKLVSLNYQRVQFKLEPINLIKYTQNGEKITTFHYSQMIHILDEELVKIKKQFSHFDVGFIILGNKELTQQQNNNIFEFFAASKWSKLIAFDFQQTIEDSFPPLAKFNEIIDQILIKYQDLPIAKICQAGNSSNHSNSNIQDAINSGALRISNGLNILQQVDLLSKCKNTCFQINPILNLCQGASKRIDFRMSIAPILLGLGFPLTINSDISGILGFEDTIHDLYVSAISFNWSLKHLKLIILHSINYSCTTEGNKRLMMVRFYKSWLQWINSLDFTEK